MAPCRAVAICAGLLGMMLVATTTASLSTVLEWSTLEQTAKGVIHREFVHMRRIDLSVKMIQRWWRARMKELKINGGTRYLIMQAELI